MSYSGSYERLNKFWIMSRILSCGFFCIFTFTDDGVQGYKIRSEKKLFGRYEETCDFGFFILPMIQSFKSFN